MNWLRKLFEDPNGVPDDARIAAMGLVAVYIICSLAAVWWTKHFDMLAFGGGAAALAGGISAWFGFRKGN